MSASAASTGWRAKLRKLLGRDGGEFPRVELEPLLHEADLSAALAGRLLETAERSGARGRDEILARLRDETAAVISRVGGPPKPLPVPAAVLLLGVNGAGKTTVAGKLAARYRAEGKKVVLAAADTFRAGAAEQLALWAGRTGAEIVRQPGGADPAAVVFDAWKKARAEGAVMVADTAGRLHTQSPLMEQLKKIVRILGKEGEGAPHEVYLVLDGTGGQNVLAQSREFHRAVPLTGLIVTKLDGTARGGGVLSASLELSVPIRYVGTGEQAGDLSPFDAAAFADALFRV